MTSIPRSVAVRMEGLSLEGILNVPERARSIVLFAHGSGRSRHSPRREPEGGIEAQRAVEGGGAAGGRPC